MNHKHLLALFLCFVIIISSRIAKTDNKPIQIKEVIQNIDEYKIESIVEDNEKEKISIFYPVTNCENVNLKIRNKIEEYKKKFNETNTIQSKKQLDISFDTYKYEDYISFKFNVKMNTGITHDIEEVFTLVYKKDQIIDIEYLLGKDATILDTLQKECLENLKDNEKIKEYSTSEWLEKGLAKQNENYSEFVLTEDFFVVIFNEYKIAPYVAGIFEVEIPYDKLIKIVD